MLASKTILLVEDNPDDQALTLRAMKKNGITNTVIVVEDGAEALDYIFSTGKFASRSAIENPQLVILDIKLPKLSGIEVLKKLRADQRTKFLPVVMLTSSKEEQDVMASYSNGCNSYVRKPVDFDEFANAVKTLGLYWLVVNQAV